FFKIVDADSSSQFKSTFLIMYPSAPEGIDLKKFPDKNLQRGKILLLVTSELNFSCEICCFCCLAFLIACGKSNTIPVRLGLSFKIVDKNSPCPPPISTTVLNCEKSYNLEIDETCDEVIAVIASLNIFASIGFC